MLSLPLLRAFSAEVQKEAAAPMSHTGVMSGQSNAFRGPLSKGTGDSSNVKAPKPLKISDPNNMQSLANKQIARTTSSTGPNVHGGGTLTPPGSLSAALPAAPTPPVTTT